MQVFRHFEGNIGNGDDIPLKSIFAVKHKFLARYSSEDIIKGLNNLEDEGITINSNNSVRITAKGKKIVFS